MGKRPALLRFWYGPDTYENPEQLMMGHRSTSLHSGVLSVTDVQEAIALTAGVYEANIKHAPPGSEVVVRSNSALGSVRFWPRVAELAAAEWKGIGFDIGFASQVADPPDEWNRYVFHDSLGLYFSSVDVRITGESARTPSGLPSVRESVAPQAHDVALEALLSGLGRRTPPIRWAQTRAVVLPIAVTLLWLWALTVWQPPLALWVFTGALTALAAHTLFVRVSIPSVARADRIGVQPWGTPRVDLTPRAEVLARRASQHRDAKVAVFSGVFTLAAAFVAAYFTGVWTPGTGG